MEDQRIFSLTYGNVGGARYDESLKTWKFDRKPGRRNILYPVGESTLVIEASASPASSDQSAEENAREKAKDEARARARKAHDREIMELAKSNPHLAAAMPVVRELHYTSKALETLDHAIDPAVSKLFDVGRAGDANWTTSVAHSYSVAAMAAGQDRMVLRIVQLVESKAEWPHDVAGGSTKLGCMTFANQSTGWWGSESGQIRQVRFGHALHDHNMWLAVRTTAGTSILQPIIDAEPRKSTNLLTGELIYSRVLPKPRIFIPHEETGTTPHADVAFNPWNHRQLAVVHEDGRWSVIELVMSAWAPPKRWEIPSSGNIFKGIQREQTDEGWAKICWVADTNTVAVCTRRLFKLYSLGAKPVLLESPDLGLQNTAHWILDVHASQVLPDIVFLVTSASIFLVRVTPQAEMELEEDAAHGGRIVLAWQHFRHEEDTTLQMEVSEEEDLITVTLYSKANSLVSVYQFGVPDNLEPYSASDPYFLEIPKPSSVSGNAKSPQCNLLGLSLSSCRYLPNSKKGHPEGIGHSYEEAGVRFSNVFAMFSNLSCFSGFYAEGYLVDDTNGKRIKALAPVLPTGRNKQFAQTSRFTHGRKSASTIKEDDFIVNDYSESSESEPASGQEKKTTFNKLVILPKTPPRPVGKAANRNAALSVIRKQNTFVLDAILKFHDLRGKQNITEYVSSLEQKIWEKVAQGDQPNETISGIIRPGLFTDDFGDVSKTLNSFLTSQVLIPRILSESLELSVQPLFDPSLYGFPFSGRVFNKDFKTAAQSPLPDLSMIYDNLISCWVAPLPASVSLRARIAKERLARQIAIELYLASFGISLKYPPPIPLPPQLVTSDANEYIGGSQSSVAGFGGSQSQDGGMTPLSARMRFATPSSIYSDDPEYFSQRSQTSELGGEYEQEDQEDPVMARLRSYATIRESHGPPFRLSNSVKKITAQWRVGTNPENFSWLAFKRAEAANSDSETGRTGSGSESGRSRRKSLSARSASSRSRSRSMGPLSARVSEFGDHRQQRDEAEASGPPGEREPMFLRPPARRAPRGFYESQQQPHLQSEGQYGNFPSSSQQPGFGAAKSSQVAASQEVPGPFGARQGIKKAKKKRKMGF